jgi:hypothetical protein
LQGVSNSHGASSGYLLPATELTERALGAVEGKRWRLVLVRVVCSVGAPPEFVSAALAVTLGTCEPAHVTEFGTFSHP